MRCVRPRRACTAPCQASDGQYFPKQWARIARSAARASICGRSGGGDATVRVVAVRCGAVQRVGGGGCAAKGRTEGCCLAAVWAGCCEEERDWQAQSLAGVKTPSARRFDAISDQMSKVFATLHACLRLLYMFTYLHKPISYLLHNIQMVRYSLSCS
jgi:hypothetical protein